MENYDDFLKMLIPKDVDKGISPDEAAKAKEMMEKAMGAVYKVHRATSEIKEEYGRHYDSLSPEEKKALIDKRVKDNDQSFADEVEDLTS